MKKSLLFLSSYCFGILAVQAQITITTADVVVPPKIIYQSVDTMPTISQGSAGVSQTWNMAALNTHSTDTMNFIPMASGWGLLDVTTFPTSNLVVKNGWQANYGYAQNSASGLNILGNIGMVDPGTGTPVQVTQINTPAEKLITFPSNYLTTFSNNFTSGAQFYLGIDPGIGFVVDSVRIKSIVSKTNLCDAWGNITTPLGTYASLRYHETKQQTDSIFGLIGGFGWIFFQENLNYTNKYNWWANGVGFPLVEVDMDSLGTVVTGARWLQALPAVGINEFTSAYDMNVFPNPAQNEIYFYSSSAEINFVQVFDVAGRLVNEIKLTSNQISLNVSNYANGMYTYTALGKDKNILSRGKFTVSK